MKDNPNNHKHFDIIIVGGGMVGAAFACHVASQNEHLSIAVMDAFEAKHNWDSESFDIRVSALTHKTIRYFKNLKVWEAMKAERVCPYQQMRVWDNALTDKNAGKIHFNSEQAGTDNLGYIIENRVIQKALFERLYQLNNISYISPIKLKTISFNPENVTLTDEQLNTFVCKLIVGADGANSWVRQQAGIEITSWKYQQTALVTTIKTSKSHQNTCWQQFMPNGPLAFLPIQENICSIVWSTTQEDAEMLHLMSDDEFNQGINEVFISPMGKLSVCSSRGIFPLQMRHAKHYVKNNLALIGDAAHTVHPLAGQGVNLGFSDAQQLAVEIKQALLKRRNPYSYNTLRKYERCRKGSNVAMLAALDIIKRLFSNNDPLLKLVRNSGLNLVDSSDFAKRFFMDYALGNYESQTTDSFKNIR